MKLENKSIVRHIFLAVTIAVLVVVCAILPFISGRYVDGVLTLSLVAQIIGVASVVLVPIGIALLVYRLIKRKPFGALPIYLILVPVISLIAQLTLATTLTEYSRKVAIENSAKIIRDIETYRAENGKYPTSLFAPWKDYSPSIIGTGIGAWHP